MKTDLMLDLETLGTRHDAVVLSIGAVAFDVSGLHEQTFYAAPDHATQRFGTSVLTPRSTDSATETWWAAQSSEARAVFQKPQAALDTALVGLEHYIDRVTTGRQEVRVWGNGATFDNVILAHLFEWAGRPVPWHWRHGRCFRTLRAALPLSVVEYAEVAASRAFGGTPEYRRGWLVPHRADHDALWQAEVCVGLLHWLRAPVARSAQEAT